MGKLIFLPEACIFKSSSLLIIIISSTFMLGVTKFLIKNLLVFLKRLQYMNKNSNLSSGFCKILIIYAYPEYNNFIKNILMKLSHSRQS